MGKSITRRSALTGAAASAAAFSMANTRSANAAPNMHQVTIRKFAFEPQRIQVRAGDTIRWTNEDLAPHTATADELGWDTGEIAKGQSHEMTANKDMETTYFCVFHPHMKGSIEIV